MPNGDEERTESADTAESPAINSGRDEIAKQSMPRKMKGEIKFVRIGCSRLVAEEDEDSKHQKLSFIGEDWGTRKINHEYLGVQELNEVIDFLTDIKNDLVKRP
jgi:hypothetical protein